MLLNHYQSRPETVLKSQSSNSYIANIALAAGTYSETSLVILEQKLFKNTSIIMTVAFDLVDIETSKLLATAK